MYNNLIKLIFDVAPFGFNQASEQLMNFVNKTDDLLGIVQQIGTIPEAIAHDSTEEKLFSKASDAILSRVFQELGLKSAIITGRADTADVVAQSPIHGYSLVADAKVFRMSRTAKNQKDFKVNALSGWRKDADYAVLCSPHFQYPRSTSQIYKQALDNNVALISWEHIVFLIKHKIKEDEAINLAPIWNFSGEHAQNVVISESKKCFIPTYSRFIMNYLWHGQDDFNKLLDDQIEIIKQRGIAECSYWESQKKQILLYSREQAVAELIKSKKIDEKISQIGTFVRRLQNA
ncbi:MAG: HindIII family type II restriction endonuclease [Defluviitaleaceae bacterium]|nr:HindIII family type II restriction endonuclease [Defluviitaleaceae bacterium]